MSSLLSGVTASDGATASLGVATQVVASAVSMEAVRALVTAHGPSSIPSILSNQGPLAPPPADNVVLKDALMEEVKAEAKAVAIEVVYGANQQSHSNFVHWRGKFITSFLHTLGLDTGSKTIHVDTNWGKNKFISDATKVTHDELEHRLSALLSTQWDEVKRNSNLGNRYVYNTFYVLFCVLDPSVLCSRFRMAKLTCDTFVRIQKSGKAGELVESKPGEFRTLRDYDPRSLKKKMVVVKRYFEIGDKVGDLPFKRSVGGCSVSCQRIQLFEVDAKGERLSGPVIFVPDYFLMHAVHTPPPDAPGAGNSPYLDVL